MHTDDLAYELKIKKGGLSILSLSTAPLGTVWLSLQCVPPVFILMANFDFVLVTVFWLKHHLVLDII